MLETYAIAAIVCCSLLGHIQGQDCVADSVNPASLVDRECGTIATAECYNSNVAGDCCATCDARSSGLANCPYGDRRTDCSNFPLSDCNDVTWRNETCCAYCPENALTSSECPFGDANDCSIITQETVSLCYSNDIAQSCCGTCNALAALLPDLPGNCSYGDSLPGSICDTSTSCETSPSGCCATCHANQMTTSTVVTDTTTQQQSTTECANQETGCSSVTSSQCYISNIESICCLACRAIFVPDAPFVCRYGDRASECNAAACTVASAETECCETCSDLLPTQAPDITTTETSPLTTAVTETTTPEVCLDMATITGCPDIEPSECYLEAIQTACCASCQNKIVPGATESCKYGDQEPNCNVGACNEQIAVQSCCSTCNAFLPTTTVSPSCSDHEQCTEMTTKTSNCYSSEIRSLCPCTCQGLIDTTLPETCPYGNRVDVCGDILSNMTCSAPLDTACCKSCYRVTQTTVGMSSEPATIPTTEFESATTAAQSVSATSTTAMDAQSTKSEMGASTTASGTTTDVVCSEDSAFCPQWTSPKSGCYNADIFSACNCTCTSLRSTVLPETCSFGDFLGFCEDIVVLGEICPAEVEGACCESCFISPTTTTEIPTTTTTPLPTTTTTVATTTTALPTTTMMASTTSLGTTEFNPCPADNPLCSQWTSFKSSCYLPSISAACSCTCEALKNDSLPESCQYGDRAPVCAEATCSSEDEGVCCETCFFRTTTTSTTTSTTTTTEATTTTTEAATTTTETPTTTTTPMSTTPMEAQCTDTRPQCVDILPRQCYQSIVQEVCCSKCETELIQGATEACRFGDQTDRCDSNTCSEEIAVSSCCSTCAAFLPTVAPPACPNDSSFCPQATTARSACYTPFIVGACPCACGLLQNNALPSTCPFGDRADTCANVTTETACTNAVTASICCESCFVPTTTTTEVDTTTTEAITTTILHETTTAIEMTTPTVEETTTPQPTTQQPTTSDPTTVVHTTTVVTTTVDESTSSETTTAPPTTTTVQCSGDSAVCPSWTSVRSRCYTSLIFISCPCSCELLKIPGLPESCEYGNLAAECDGASCAGSEASVCCETCFRATTGPTESTAVVISTALPNSSSQPTTLFLTETEAESESTFPVESTTQSVTTSVVGTQSKATVLATVTETEETTTVPETTTTTGTRPTQACEDRISFCQQAIANDDQYCFNIFNQNLCCISCKAFLTAAPTESSTSSESVTVTTEIPTTTTTAAVETISTTPATTLSTSTAAEQHTTSETSESETTTTRQISSAATSKATTRTTSTMSPKTDISTETTTVDRPTTTLPFTCINDISPTCPSIAAQPGQCYNPAIETNCCRSCIERLIPNSPKECRYGDRMASCSAENAAGCSTASVREVCCRKCEDFVEPTTTGTLSSTATSPPTTSTTASIITTMTEMEPSSTMADSTTTEAVEITTEEEQRVTPTANCTDVSTTSCPGVADKIGQCYSADIEKACCLSCFRKRVANATYSCRYGDASSSCLSEDAAECSSSSVRELCCSKCKDFVIPVQSSTVTIAIDPSTVRLPETTTTTQSPTIQIDTTTTTAVLSTATTTTPTTTTAETTTTTTAEPTTTVDDQVPRPPAGCSDISETCQSIATQPGVCYNPEIERVCCVSCFHQLILNATFTCRYGDANADCSTRDAASCSSAPIREACCEMCQDYAPPTTTMAATVSEGDTMPTQDTTSNPVHTTTVLTTTELPCTDLVLPDICPEIPSLDCYRPVVQSSCCLTCASRVVAGADPKCQYGDRIDGCNVISCTTNDTQSDCCYTCRNYVYVSTTTTAKPTTTTATTTTKAATTTSTTEAPSTTTKKMSFECPTGDTRSDCLILISHPSACYVNAGDCCQTCVDAIANFPSLPATCKYGDKSATVCPNATTAAAGAFGDLCASQKEVCCATCLDYVPPSTPVPPTPHPACPAGDTDAFCEQRTVPSFECYSPVVRQSCCNTCKLREISSASSSCLYGDKASWCTDVEQEQSILCPIHAETCCRTCASYFTTAPATTTTASATPGSTSIPTTVRPTTTTTTTTTTTSTTLAPIVVDIGQTAVVPLNPNTQMFYQLVLTIASIDGSRDICFDGRLNRGTASYRTMEDRICMSLAALYQGLTGCFVENFECGSLVAKVYLETLSSTTLYDIETLGKNFQDRQSAFVVTGVIHGDINECGVVDYNTCSPAGSCTNSVGSYFCTCLPGWADLSPDQSLTGRACKQPCNTAAVTACVSIDSTSTCEESATNEGPVLCKCPDGTRVTAGNSCPATTTTQALPPTAAANLGTVDSSLMPIFVSGALVVLIVVIILIVCICSTRTCRRGDTALVSAEGGYNSSSLGSRFNGVPTAFPPANYNSLQSRGSDIESSFYPSLERQLPSYKLQDMDDTQYVEMSVR